MYRLRSHPTFLVTLPSMYFRAIVLFVLALFQTIAASAQVDDPIETESGLLTAIAGADGSVHVYKGIPFAAAPVGELRWKPPHPPESWAGVREADEFGDACMQNLPGSRPPWTEEFMHQGAVSEDCLYLNVWAPAEAEQRPVLVYVHGGGFQEGSGSVEIYDGEALADQGLVVVTINYRLGVFGFLAHPELRAESEHDASGNYALLDQIAALEWVRDNIAAFGGDPENVTVAGQSAGAMSVYLLTASPLAAGLFDRAIVQSGPGGLASFGISSLRGLATPLEKAEKGGVAFAESKGASSIEELRALSADELMAQEDGQPVRFGAVLDGYFLLDDVAQIYEEGQQVDIPMLTGFNADEASAFPGYGTANVEEFEESARERYGEQADAFLELYPAETDDAAGEAQKVSMRERGAVALARLARERAKTSKTAAYLYYFERGIPWPEYPHFDAFHSGELPYMFDNLDLMDRQWEEVDRSIADAISSYWVNFAATGDPNGDDLPMWKPFSRAPNEMMVFGEWIGMREVVPDEARRAFFNETLERE